MIKVIFILWFIFLIIIRIIFYIFYVGLENYKSFYVIDLRIFELLNYVLNLVGYINMIFVVIKDFRDFILV